MAPEVGVGKPYNHTCDSYSFAILLWQMMSCEEPFTRYNMRLLRKKVWTGHNINDLLLVKSGLFQPSFFSNVVGLKICFLVTPLPGFAKFFTKSVCVYAMEMILDLIM
mmetsp:Transcript_747/g.976  ORF Transcript_747/g.976 Transcript_747/m.976 type:complete len:108 (+) Transcript_747:992-1315(+)